MRGEPLPQIFASWPVKYSQRVSETEYSSECPACGGTPHSDGEWPDRCRWFLKGKPLGWCRRCKQRFWPDANGKIDEATWEASRKQQTEAEERRRISAERALAYLRDTRAWEAYYARSGTSGHELWHERGVSDAWQRYWQLGYAERVPFTANGQMIPGGSLTIPIFDGSWQAMNIKHRLLEPPKGVGKYRYEYRRVSDDPYLFLTVPDEALTGRVVLVEGEIKAMVTWIYAGEGRLTVVGMPGITPSAEIAGPLAQAEHITIVVDPGCKKQGVHIANGLGPERCSLLVPVSKIDDGILAAQMTPYQVRRMIDGATPLTTVLAEMRRSGKMKSGR